MLIKAGSFRGLRWDNRGGAWIGAVVHGKAEPETFEFKGTAYAYCNTVEHLNRIPQTYWLELFERPDASAFVGEWIRAFVRQRELVEELAAIGLRREVAQSQAAGLLAMAGGER